MDYRQKFQNLPENTKRDRQRHEAMRIVDRPYGNTKIFLKDVKIFGCEKCIFDSGEHTCGR